MSYQAHDKVFATEDNPEGGYNNRHTALSNLFYDWQGPALIDDMEGRPIDWRLHVSEMLDCGWILPDGVGVWTLAEYLKEAEEVYY